MHNPTCPVCNMSDSTALTEDYEGTQYQCRICGNVWMVYSDSDADDSPSWYTDDNDFNDWVNPDGDNW